MNRFLVIFGKPRYLGSLETTEGETRSKGDALIVETARGLESALVAGQISPEQEQVYRDSRSGESDGPARGGEPLLQDVSFVRSRTAEDEAELVMQRTEEDSILRKSRLILEGHNLAMKLVDVELLLDRKKLFFYFTAEQRVDFRAFVRDLAREFRTRIELRQIGIRDEAKVVKGISPCGLPCCCSYWLHRFMPICIKMVKEQNLALNPTKISGLCGRLMCCMSYEHDTYHDLWKNLPNPGSKIRTNSGTYILCGVDLAAESVRVLVPGGGDLLVPVGRFGEFKKTVTEGGTWEATEAFPNKDDLPTAVSSGSREDSGGEGRNSRRSRQQRGASEKTAVTDESKPRSEEKGNSREQGDTPTVPGGDEKAPKKRRRRRKSKNKTKSDSRGGEKPISSEGTPSGETPSDAASSPEGDKPKKKRRRPRNRKPRPPQEKTTGES